MTQTQDATAHVTAARQHSNCVLMVRPLVFFSNPETAQSNEFQTAVSGDGAAAAQAEFDALVATLRTAGVRVLVVEDTPEPATPDAVFPNNWLSTHADGRVVTYPMQPLSRRAERRADVLAALAQQHGFSVCGHVDLSHFEADEKFLEGTGSMVLDRVHRVAYACRSVRTHDEVLAAFATQMGYRVVAFDAFGASGKPVYHTNVMLCIGADIAVVCLEAIAASHRERVAAELAAHHELVPISLAQMGQFAGNMLELANDAGEPLLLMSSRARAALTAGQVAQLERHVRLLHAPVNAIEDAAGGSVRCMLAEVFLPRADPPRDP